MDSDDTDLMEGLVSVMFCAAPKAPVTIGKEKMFYNIFCFYYPKVDKYIIFFKIYTINKRKRKNGLYFKAKKSFNLSFSYKEEVFGSLNKFLFQFPEHERFINEEILETNEVELSTAMDSINEWEFNLLKYFNELIPELN